MPGWLLYLVKVILDLIFGSAPVVDTRRVEAVTVEALVNPDHAPRVDGVVLEAMVNPDHAPRVDGVVIEVLVDLDNFNNPVVGSRDDSMSLSLPELSIN